jgi:hypothetical protein
LFLGVFDVKHIVVHKIPDKIPFKLAEIEGFLQSSRQFADACGWVVVECLHGAVPRTQAQMNQMEGGALSQILAEMTDLV